MQVNKTPKPFCLTEAVKCMIEELRSFRSIKCDCAFQPLCGLKFVQDLASLIETTDGKFGC